ncbi:MAG: Ger(x)C family spore germination protein [Bacillota bacterium]|nr:Ger(x)C family spore germination protein [Bacillota bacterium]
MTSQFLQHKLPLLLISIAVLLLTGCWDRKEVNDLGLVTAAGIDKISNKTIELSALVYIPKSVGGQQSMNGGSGGGSAQTLVRSATGVTVADAMSKLQQKLPRHIFWGHTAVFIFDEKLAKMGLAKHVDFILRHPQLRERSEIFITKQKARKVLGVLPPLERDLSTVLRELESMKMGMEVTAKNFAEMLLSDSGDTAVPYIKMLPPEEGRKKKETIAYITGTAIFKKDKMVGIIDASVTRGVLWLRNEIQLATVTVQPKEAKGYVSLSLLEATTELIPKIEHGKWKMVFKADADADVIQNTTKLDMANPKVIKSLQQQLEKEIEAKVKLALVQVQKDMKADVFGFGDAFHRKYPGLWKKNKDRWDNIFPNVEVTIHSNMKIRRHGMNSVISSIFLNKVNEK